MTPDETIAQLKDAQQEIREHKKTVDSLWEEMTQLRADLAREKERADKLEKERAEAKANLKVEEDAAVNALAKCFDLGQQKQSTESRLAALQAHADEEKMTAQYWEDYAGKLLNLADPLAEICSGIAHFTRADFTKTEARLSAYRAFTAEGQKKDSV